MAPSKPVRNTPVPKSIRTPNGVQMVYANEFFCTYCPKDFNSIATRRDHEKRHDRVTSFSCEDCHASFFRKLHLQQHKKVCSRITQLGETIKWCDFCDHFFKTDQRLKNHYCEAHGILYDPESAQKYKQANQFVPLICDLCGWSFSSKFLLGTHRYIKHKIGKSTEESAKSTEKMPIQGASRFSIVEWLKSDDESMDSDQDQ